MIRIILEELSSSEISKLQKTTGSQFNLLNAIDEQKIISRRNIYQNIFPIIDGNLELQVSSFENDNYYDDGYTFFRSNLEDIDQQDKEITIPLENTSLKYFLIKLNYGYGAGFETEIIDLDYKSFETEKLNFNSISLFEKYDQALHSLSLNYLDLEDLGRSKYEVLKTELILVQNHLNIKQLDLSTKISDQVKVLDTKSYS